MANLRSVRVTYSTGDVIPTNMAVGLTDEQIKEYFAIGRVFNLGSVSDRMAKVTKLDIIDTPTDCYLKPYNQDELPTVGKYQFRDRKRVKISELHSNQKYINNACLLEKSKGKYLSDVYVLDVNEKKILMDGNHTVISKLLKEQKYVYCFYKKVEI